MKTDQNERASSDSKRAARSIRPTCLSLNAASVTSFGSDIGRFFDLIFGYPFRTPTAAEHAMFLAFADSPRSADLVSAGRSRGRVSADEVIATGANNVPCHGGGLYWPGIAVQRDHAWGENSNGLVGTPKGERQWYVPHATVGHGAQRASASAEQSGPLTDGWEPFTLEIVQNRMMLASRRRRSERRDPASHVLLAPGDARRAAKSDSGASPDIGNWA
jgi:hypothetical protein